MEIIKTLDTIWFGGHKPWYETDDPFSDQFQVRKPCLLRHHNRNNQLLAEYILDSRGFRGTGSIQDKLWFLGCSDTFGESLPQQQIYPQLVADALGQSYYNFGTPGASVELVAKLLFKVRAQIPNKKIVVLLPSMLRYETIVDGKFKNLVPRNSDYLDHLPQTGMDNHIRHKILSAVMLIKSLTDAHDCSFFHLHPFENDMEEEFRNQLGSVAIPQSLMIDRAADNKHYGAATNRAIADFMLKFLRQ